MSVRSGLIVLVALAFGGTAAYSVNALRGNTAVASEGTVTVVVAAGDVSRFTTLTPELLKTREYPKDLAPPSSLRTVDEAVDRVADAPFLKGEPIQESQLSPKGAGRGAAAIIPNGMRAVTVKTPDAQAGVAGFALPGNKVDVLMTVRGNSEDPAGGGSTITLLQGVLILAVDQRVEAPSENKVDLKELRSVTLLVTPEQAAKLDLGQIMGTLHLSLRNPLDTTPVKNGNATLRGLQVFAAQPWEVRFKGLLDSATKLMASRPAAKEKEKPTPVTAEAPPPPLMIRTLRGYIPSTVPLQ